MMTENIELFTYPSRKRPDEEDIEVYDEIRQDIISKNTETTYSQRLLPDPISNFDFFTKREPKPTPKKSEKKRKGKKKETSSNLMDIVNSELALLSIPISENVIEIVKETNFIDYLHCFSGDFRTIQRRQSYFNRRYQNSQSVHLRPVFPDMEGPLESRCVPVVYVEPASFDDMVTTNDYSGGEHLAKFLDVELKNIKFSHHHKYSLENVLCLKLTKQYEEYERLQKKLPETLRDIKIFREARNNLKLNLLKVSPSKTEELRFDSTMRKYTGELFELKEKYREEFKEYQQVIHTILSLWSDIEMVREKNERRDAPYDLYIKKYKLSGQEMEKEWSDLYEDEFTDALDKLEYEYVTKYIEYKEARSECQENNSKRKLNKPKMILDEEVLKTQVEQLINNIIQREKLNIKLVKTEKNVSETSESNHYYHFEVYVDGTFVCKTEDYRSIDESLNANFNESFTVEIQPRNETLTFVLFENNEEMADVQVNFSKVKNINANEDFSIVEFQYNDANIATTDKNVGSGCSMKELAAKNKVRLKSSNLFKGGLTTKCNVLVRIGWREITNQMAIKSSMEIGRKLLRLLNGRDKPNIDTVTDIIEMVYSKDVRHDEDMIKTIKKLCKLTVKANDKFHVDKNNPELIRLKLLHLRNSGGFTHVENKMIPIHGSQISTEQLNCLQRTKEKDIDVDYLKSKEVDMDHIELQRFIAAKYMQKLNKDVMRSLNDHLMVKTHRDVVRVHQNFGLRSLFSRQINSAVFAPISSKTKVQILTDSLNQEHEIQITVLRAFNLLDRSTVAIIDETEDDTETIAGFKVRPLRPFVRISYHGVSAKTVTAMGCHPTWNHTLKICTKLNPLSVLQINIYDEYKENMGEDTADRSARTVHYRYCNKWLGTAQIPLFTVLSLGTLRGTFRITTPPLLFGYETIQNKESSSLIPEVTRLMKKDTSFISLHITSSLSHLGGFQAYNQPLPITVEDDYIIKHLNSFVTNYTNDFPNRHMLLTFIDSAGRNKCVTQFLQPIPMPNREYFPKNPKSCGSAMSKSSGFSRSSSSKSSGRKRDVDIETGGEKESVYSQGSWKGGDNLGKMINNCLRYVALIPSYEVTETHSVTLMGLELLKVLQGTPLDLTILLSSYFLYLGIRSWIAVGAGLPRGRSSYVMIQYDLAARRYVLTSDVVRSSRGFLRSDGYMWIVCDVITGERCDLRDVACPFKTVDFVFDSENIWVNVQSSQDCESVVFDFSKSSDWRPVFDTSIFVMKHPIVNDANLYSAPSKVDQLRQALESKIRGKVQKWRVHLKTIWNRYCSSLLREALLYWEYWSFNPNESKPGFSHKFKQLMVTYKVSGFPLNVPFICTKSVISAVKSTGLHASDDPGVEFGLAVEVYAYPNNVLSVWVFFATISKV